MAETVTQRVGPERVLLGCYGLFVVAAGARSAVQLSLHAARAPLAYTLSAVAAVGYAVGFALIRAVTHGRAASAARVACAVELLGVLAVGTASLLWPDEFPDPTVWSHFGAGYAFVPLVLPIAALIWLRVGESVQAVDRDDAERLR